MSEKILKVVPSPESKMSPDAATEASPTPGALLDCAANAFKLLMFLTLAMVPLVMLIGTAKKAPGAKQDEPIHAMD